MAKIIPKDRFLILQASEDIYVNKIKYLGNSRAEVLETKMAIELAKKFDTNYALLSEGQLQILENYLLKELEKVNPLKPQEGFEFVYQNAIHFYLRLKNYDQVLELYKRLQRLINDYNLEVSMDCLILTTIAYIKLNRLDIARRTYNYIINYFEHLSIEQKNTTEILFKELFKEHDIDIKKVL
jgi:tetratricopeptide (TPR) repeat protein